MTARIIVTPRDAFAVTASAHIAEAMERALAARRACSIALCGGSTPEPVYRQLSTSALSWRDVTIFFGDERAVPADDPESNYAMARRALLDRVPVPAAQVHRMEGERPDLDRAADDYARLLPDHLDVLLLGVGPDGHTASLFPRSAALSETARRVVAAPCPSLPVQPQVARLTITPPVIAAASEVIVMVSGAPKAPLLARILEGPDAPVELPAQLARGGTWILDPAAASLLQQREH